MAPSGDAGAKMRNLFKKKSKTAEVREEERETEGERASGRMCSRPCGHGRRPCPARRRGQARPLAPQSDRPNGHSQYLAFCLGG